MMSKRRERLSEINSNNENCTMKIVKYINSNEIYIEFQDEHKAQVRTSYQMFKKGKVKNPYYRSVYSIGFVGVGKHPPTINSRSTKIYNSWSSMLQRCSKEYQSIYQSYKGCQVCSEWNNFQNFADWYVDNIWGDENIILQVDKDILIHNNRIYSPETCVLVDGLINSLYARKLKKGKYMQGVSFDYDKQLYVSQCGINNGEHIFLGYFNNQTDAFNRYKNFKENHIKQIAQKYKNTYIDFPQKLYNAMMTYSISWEDEEPYYIG